VLTAFFSWFGKHEETTAGKAKAKLDSTIRQEKAGFLQPKTSSVIIRSIKGYLKHIGMNYLGMKS